MERAQQKPPEMHPEVAQALGDYEEAMRYGNEREQKETFEALRRVRQRLGNVAVLKTRTEDEQEAAMA